MDFAQKTYMRDMRAEMREQGELRMTATYEGPKLTEGIDRIAPTGSPAQADLQDRALLVPSAANAGVEGGHAPQWPFPGIWRARLYVFVR